MSASVTSRDDSDNQTDAVLFTRLDEIKQVLLEEISAQLNQVKNEILQVVSTEINVLKEELKSVSTKLEAVSLKVQQNSPLENTIIDIEEPVAEEQTLHSQTVVTIEGHTNEEEEQLLLLELKSIKELVGPTSNGSTIQGKTVADILTDASSSYKATITVQFTNYLESSLNNPRCYFAEGFEYRVAPKVVASCTKEAFVFQSARGVLFAGDRIYGIFSYQIGSSDKQLIVKFACREDGLIMSGLGIASNNVPINGNTLTYMENALGGSKSIRVDLKGQRDWKTEGQEWIVKLGNIRARATITPGPRSILEVEVAQAESRKGLEGVYERTRSIANGKTMLEKFLPGIAGFINDKRVCIVELVNLLNVPLEDSLRYIHNCQQHDFMPNIVPAMTREAFYTSDHTNVEGIFSYRIATTDLRIAVAFRCQAEGNSFAVAFTPADMPTEKRLMDDITTGDEWITRSDRRFAIAKEGDKMAEVRNLRAVAAMTDQEKSVLKLVIYAT
ncbi:unnamed protein product [Allacma fusca]|uniref:Uncharacterized protein n=1 Tax=Allacma fusca TaxID=39272 RepID=A0A8J2NKQ5_9HEXA|nr:unnamed protein product [Allacma fusca]